MIPNIENEKDLRKLAGLPLKEAGHSLDNILNKYPEEFKSVMMGQSMLYDHDKFFDELYDWFVNSGEMPYGIAKAREGDPDQFIQDYLEQEYGHEFDDEQAMDAQKTQMPASLGGTFGESSDMKRLAKVVADGNRSVQMLTEGEVKEKVIQPTGLQAYINKLEVRKDK